VRSVVAILIRLAHPNDVTGVFACVRPCLTCSLVSGEITASAKPLNPLVYWTRLHQNGEQHV
jgi:hypothetical protein